jgi:hypothetical protein
MDKFKIYDIILISSNSKGIYMNTRDGHLLRTFTNVRYESPKIKYWLIGLVCFFDLLLVSVLLQQKAPLWSVFLLVGVLCLALIATALTILFDRKMYKMFSEMNAFGVIELIRNKSQKIL